MISMMSTCGRNSVLSDTMGSLSRRNLSVEVGLRCHLHRAVDIKLDNGLDGTTTFSYSAVLPVPQIFLMRCRLDGTLILQL